MVFFLVTTLNIYLLRPVNQLNGSYRIDKIESIRLQQIDYIEVIFHLFFSSYSAMLISGWTKRSISSYNHYSTYKTSLFNHWLCGINTVKSSDTILIRIDLTTLFFSAICASIIKATRIAKLPQPQVLSAMMQELSIKKELANDLKKSV